MIVAAAPRGDPAPDLGRAGEGDLGDVGVLDQPLPADAARADDDVQRRPPGARPRARSRSKRSAVSGVSSAGFSTTVLPAASAGASFQAAIVSGKFQGDDQADDAERLAEGHVDAAGDRDRLAEQPLRRARVVAEGVDDHPDLAARVADRLAGVARLEHRQLLVRAGQRRRRARAAARAAPGASARHAGKRRLARAATAASTSSTPARGTSASTSSVAGSRTVSVAHGARPATCATAQTAAA